MLSLNSLTVDKSISAANIADSSVPEEAVWQVAESIHVEKATAPPTMARVRKSCALKEILLLGRGERPLPGPCNVVSTVTEMHIF